MLGSIPHLDLCQLRWFLMHLLPPLILTSFILRILRHDPSRFVKTLPSLVPGLTEPKVLKVRDRHEASWQLTFHADILNVFSAIRATNAMFNQVGARRSRATFRVTEEDNRRTVALDADPANFPTLLSDNPACTRRETMRASSIAGGRQSKSVAFDEEPNAAKPDDSRKAVSFQWNEQQSEHELDSHTVDALRRTLLEVTEAPQERVIINFSHMWRLSIIPVLFCTYYFWDGAIIRKYVSRDYPLSHCHDEFSCFYTKDFSFFFSTYYPLDCAELRARSVETGEFKFVFPKGAEFFECYEIAISVSSIVGCACDCLSLAVFFIVVTAYFMVTRVGEANDGDDQSDIRSLLDMTAEQLAAEKIDADNPTCDRTLSVLNKRIQYYIQCELFCIVGLCLSLVLVSAFMGKTFNTTGSCVLLPSVALYVFFLFDIKRESLQEYKLSVELARGDSGSSEKSPLCGYNICDHTPPKAAPEIVVAVKSDWKTDHPDNDEDERTRTTTD